MGHIRKTTNWDSSNTMTLQKDKEWIEFTDDGFLEWSVNVPTWEGSTDWQCSIKLTEDDKQAIIDWLQKTMVMPDGK